MGTGIGDDPRVPPAPPASAHPLLALLLAAADGRFPEVDGGVTLLPPLPGGQSAVVSFTGHAVIATARPPGQVRGWGVDGYGAALRPAVLGSLAGPGGDVGTIDATLVRRGTGRGSPLVAREDLDDHPRVRHARGLREDVRVYADERGLVTLSAGLAGRRELSIEVAAGRQGRGIGPSLLADALGLVRAEQPVFAAVAPGNARSLRVFLALDFVPVASETVIRSAP